jgi:hypothetical protein
MAEKRNNESSAMAHLSAENIENVGGYSVIFNILAGCQCG